MTPQGGPVRYQRVRPPAVAGTFYPGRRDELAAVIDRELEQAAVAFGGTKKVPHYAIHVMELDCDGDCEGYKKYIVVSSVDEVDYISWRPLPPKEVSVDVVLPDGRRKNLCLPEGHEIIKIAEYLPLPQQ